MPFSRPTLTELLQQTQTDVQSALRPDADALLRYSNLRITASVQAALANGHYGYLDYIAHQSVPFTATEESLEGWAAMKNVFRKRATPASGTVQLTGTAGITIDAGTALLRNDGVAFETTAEIILGPSGGAVTIIAAGAGVLGNCDVGTSFSIAAGVSGVDARCVATTPITGGADVESYDELRARMLFAYANPSQGGSLTDYEQWATAVPGVTRCWPVPEGMGPSTVVLYFMMDVAQAAHGGFPQGTNGVATAETRDVAATGDQLTLANAIFPKQPATPIIYAAAPQPNPLHFTIAGLAGASTSLRNAINAAIDQALLVGGKPGGTTQLSTIESAIAAVNGTGGFVITNITAEAGTVTPGPAGNIVSDRGRLPQRASVVYA